MVIDPVPDTAALSAPPWCGSIGPHGPHEGCDGVKMPHVRLAPPPPAVLDDDFVVRILRSFLRAGHCSGFPLSHGTRKKYVDVVRCLEKREARRLRNA